MTFIRSEKERYFQNDLHKNTYRVAEIFTWRPLRKHLEDGLRSPLLGKEKENMCGYQEENKKLPQTKINQNKTNP